jgi:hypothetical protein
MREMERHVSCPHLQPSTNCVTVSDRARSKSTNADNGQTVYTVLTGGDVALLRAMKAVAKPEATRAVIGYIEGMR